MKSDDMIISEIIEMAWCDKTSFDDILGITGFSEQQVIAIIRQNLKPSSYRLWRKRVSGRKSKHAKTNKLKIPELNNSKDQIKQRKEN